MWPFTSSFSGNGSKSVAADLEPPIASPSTSTSTYTTSSTASSTTPQTQTPSYSSSSVPTASGPRLNIPAGNSPISEPTYTADEKLSGDKWTDYKAALKRISPTEDIQKIGDIPCARSSLLYGIGGGSAIGAVRYLGSRSPKAGANWAVMGFVVIALTQWEMCNRARAKELAQMRVIQERFPHRHISTLQKVEPGGPPTSPRL